MPKIFIIVPHNNPSGGTKVANQIINLFAEKDYWSFLVISEGEVKKASFLNNPAPVIQLNEFNKICAEEDIVITFWQSTIIHEAIKNCPAKNKIFWQHGIIVPRYSDFNGEEVYKPGVYTDYWNVSRACADYIKKKYKLSEMKIVPPFFDDQTLLEYQKESETTQREGFLIAQRRGQEAIPDIKKLLSGQKITILDKNFSDEQLYSELIKHKFFISTDNGVYGRPLIKNKLKRFLKTLKIVFRNHKNNKTGQISWIKQNKNLLGFPMTACEAAWLGTNVVAFAMGGGLEWMTPENIYLAKDNNINSLLKKIKEAVNTDEKELAQKRKLATESVKKFNQENIWKILSENLNLK